MKLIGKLVHSEEIRQHLQQVVDTRVYVRMYSKEGDYLQKGLLEIDAANNNCLTFSPVPVNKPCPANMTCQYTFESIAWVFQTQRIDVDETQVSLAMPEMIQQYDRRKIDRIKPSKKAAVYISFTLPGKTILRMPASDVGVGGFSVLVLRDKDFFSVGDAFEVVIEMPGKVTLNAKAVVKGAASLLNITRVVFNFHELPGDEENKLVSYIMSHRGENNNELRGRTNAIKPKACIVETDADAESFSFLKEHYRTKIVSHLNAVGHLKQHPPEIILLDMNQSGAVLILRTVSTDRHLKDLPLILLGKKSSKVKQRSGVVVTIDFPYKPPYLLKTMGELIEKIRLVKEVEENFWQYFSSQGKTIAIVDPRHRFKKMHFKPLKNIDFNLVWIEDEKAIVDLLNDAQPDVIVLNDDTGQMNAATLCRMINQNKQIKNIPKVLMVPEKELAESTSFQTAGIYYLYKRFDAKQLVVGIFKALGVDI